MAPDPTSPLHPIPVGRPSGGGGGGNGGVFLFVGDRPPGGVLERVCGDGLYFFLWNAAFVAIFAAMCLACAVAFTGLAGCASTPTPDPNNGVSPASYRQCLTRTDTNLDQALPKLEALAAEDLNRPVVIGDLSSGSRHSAAWWEAELRELRQTSQLVKATLAGYATVPTPAPTSSPPR